MVTVLVDRNKEEIKILGHSGFAEYGRDIVCSAISAIVITSVNAILTFDNNYLQYEEKKDIFTIKIKKKNEITSNLITNMLNLLKELEKDYPNNIKIKEEIR